MPKLIYGGDTLAAAIFEGSEIALLTDALQLAIRSLDDTLEDLKGSGNITLAVNLKSQRDHHQQTLDLLLTRAPA